MMKGESPVIGISTEIDIPENSSEKEICGCCRPGRGHPFPYPFYG